MGGLLCWAVSGSRGCCCGTATGEAFVVRYPGELIGVMRQGKQLLQPGGLESSMEYLIPAFATVSLLYPKCRKLDPKM